MQNNKSNDVLTNTTENKITNKDMEKELNEKAYSLIGHDGNAFAIMGYVSKAMRECGHTQDEIKAYYEDAKSSDYNYLLACSMDMIEQLNQEQGYPEGHQFTKPDANKWEDQEPTSMNESAENDVLWHKATRFINRSIERCIIDVWDEYGIEFSENEMREKLHDVVNNIDFHNFSFYKYMPMVENQNNIDNSSTINENTNNVVNEEVTIEGEIKLENEPFHVTHLVPVEKDDMCLYMTEEELRENKIELNKILSILANYNKLDIIVCNNKDLQVIIKRHALYEFEHEFSRALKNEMGISTYDLKPYTYNYNEMQPIINASFKDIFKNRRA